MLSLILLLSSAQAEPVKPAIPAPAPVLLIVDGKIYQKDQFPAECKDLFKGVKCEAKPFGRVHIEAKQEGEMVHTSQTFNDPNGVQVTEDSWCKDGKIKRAVVDNRALNKVMELEVVGDKVNYKTTNKKDGSVSTSEDDLDSNLVVPSTVMAYILPRFYEILAGQEIKLRVAVLDRQSAFSFVIKKVREEKTLSGEPILVLQMAPTSIFVRAVVDPMYFYMKPQTGEMYAFEGKSALRRKEGEKYKEMIARTAYEYTINHYKPNTNTEGSSNCSDDLTKPNSMKCSIPGEMKDSRDENKTSVQN